MKIALITSFPPSRHALNEYGFHVAEQLRQERQIDLTVLGDYLPDTTPELPGFNVIRCWGFGRCDSASALLRTIWRIKPDVAWFNLGFASFGDRPLSAILGLVTPAAVRFGGVYSHVTLHQLFETVNLKDAAVSSPTLYKLGGWLATHLLLSASSISVLLPAYHLAVRQRPEPGAKDIRTIDLFVVDETLQPGLPLVRHNSGGMIRKSSENENLVSGLGPVVREFRGTGRRCAHFRREVLRDVKDFHATVEGIAKTRAWRE